MSEWTKRIKEIEGSGMSLSELARRCGSPFGTVIDIKSGRTKSPRYDLGASILREHAVIFGPAPSKPAAKRIAARKGDAAKPKRKVA